LIWATCGQIFYLVLVAGTGFVTKTANNDVRTAQVAQGIDAILSGAFYGLAFYFFTPKEPRRELLPNSTLFFAGFKQVFSTSRGIWKHYRTTLMWFFLAVLFARTATLSFLSIAVIFFIEVMDLTGIRTGFAYLVVLLSIIPGSLFARFLMRKRNPLFCVKASLIGFIVINFAGFLSLTGPEVFYLVWVFSILWGFMLGWFFPTEVNIYSSLMPNGQEAELAGFYLYCSQVLGWLPPLIFTIMNENGIRMNWGGVQLNIFAFLSLACYLMMPSWKECVEIAGSNSKIAEAENIVKKESTEA